jgi:hypothetical protein
MPLTKDVMREMRHLHDQCRGLAGATRQQIAELQRHIDANGGEADAEILAAWSDPEFRAGFKALRDALQGFGA